MFNLQKNLIDYFKLRFLEVCVRIVKISKNVLNFEIKNILFEFEFDRMKNVYENILENNGRGDTFGTSYRTQDSEKWGPKELI